jgi:hypothetical protein
VTSNYGRAVTILPTPCIIKLQLPQKQKIALMVVMSAGMLVIIAGIIRVVYIAETMQKPLYECVAMLSVRSVYSPWIVLRKRVGIRPPLIDKLSSIPIPQDGAIAPEGFVLLAIVDPFINKRINYQYNDRLLI